jgi:hypothetical protein
MFAAEIREVKQRGTAADPWDTLELPTTVRASVNGKDGHTFFRASFPEPRRIPAKGDLTFYFMGSPVLRFCYGDGISTVPTVRSATIDAEVLPTEMKELSLEAGAPVGVCRAAMPSTPEEIEADFAGYAGLPGEKWVQLNPTTDRFTLQARLRKMPPQDVHRDLGAGVYYVYGVDTLVVHVNQKAAAAASAPAGDKDKALSI